MTPIWMIWSRLYLLGMHHVSMYVGERRDTTRLDTQVQIVIPFVPTVHERMPDLPDAEPAFQKDH